MADISLRKRVWGWMAFDWASQPFYTLGLTFIFGPYFASVATTYFMGNGFEEQAADARAQSLWSLGQTLSGLVIAFVGPVLGAYADSTGRRMPWIVAFSVVYVISVSALWLMVPDGSGLWVALFAFCIGFVVAEFALIFTNAMLPSLGADDEIGKISGGGASLGYVGGVVSLFLMLLFFAENETGRTLIGLSPPFGLDPEQREGTRFVGPFSAIWFVIFMVPFFLWVREDPAQQTRPTMAEATSGPDATFGSALHDLWTSIKGILHRPSLAAYLASSMFYRDALNALYGFGGVYAVLVLDWSITMIGVFGIVGAITAAIVTYVSGLFDSRFGPKPVITVCVWVLIAVCTVIVSMSREMIFGVPLAEGSSLPDIVFYICGAAIGGAGGGLYAASRSMMVRHTNPERPTEAFGLFALSGKATAFLAPALIGLVTFITENPRLGVSPVIFLFLIALILLRWVKAEGDRAAWSDTSPSLQPSSG